MADSDDQLAQGTVDFRNEERRAANRGDDRPKVEGLTHPVTFETLLVTRENLQRAVDETHDQIGALHRAVRPLQERLAEMYGETKVPRRRDRTDTQNRAVRCPRCGHWYTEVA